MKKLSILATLCLLCTFAFAQKLEQPKAVAQQVYKAVQTGAKASPVNLFKHATGIEQQRTQLQSVVENATLLSPDISLLRKAVKDKAEFVQFEIPNTNGNTLQLELVKVDILAPGFGVRTSTSGNAYVPVTHGVHYRGILKGDANSLAAISIFDGEIMGLIAVDGANYVLGKLQGPAADGTHILYRDTDLKQSPTRPACATPDDGGTYSAADLLPQSASNKAGDCINVYMEADKDVFAAKGSVSATVNWITAMFNEVATLYGNDNITTNLSEVFVWTTNSGYNGNNASQILAYFKNTHPNYNGDIAHLVKFKNNGGIAASIGGLCTGDKRDGMSYAGIVDAYSTVPTYSFTVEMVAHELGHLLGSRHTHACVWNGNNTAIDGCSSTEGSCSSPGLPSGGGTVMSYCDFTSVGIDFNLGFGSQPTAVMQNYITAANCTSSCNSTCNNGVQDGNETGVDCGGSCAPCNTCNNGVLDGNETGVDCGGSCPPCSGGSCAVPGGTEASSIRRSRATLNWSSVSSANDYTVQLRPQGNTTWADGTTSGTSITATNLTNGTTYEWRVRANCSGSSSAYSPLCTFDAGTKNSSNCGGNRPAASMKIYPNPTNGELNVLIPMGNDGFVTVQVSDLFGRVLMETEAQTGNVSSINVSTLANGIYFVRLLNADNTTEVKKFLKE